MIASRVLKESELHDHLKSMGYKPTGEKTSTSTFWKNSKTGKHIQVPNSVQGFYPDWLLWELDAVIGKIRAS